MTVPIMIFAAALPGEWIYGTGTGRGVSITRVRFERPFQNRHVSDGFVGAAVGEGMQIPIAGRVMAIVDMYDALTSSRCYSAGREQRPVERHERACVQRMN